jgi:hypothetical protein
MSLLFEQNHVDQARLAEAVRSALRGRNQAGLVEVLGDHPLTEGLAELIGYLALADPTFTLVLDDSARDQVSWPDADGEERIADMPRAVFARTTTGES